MNAYEKQVFVRRKAVERKIKWSRYALNELAREPMTVRDVEVALHRAEVIEDYPLVHRYLPDCLIFAVARFDHPFHAVIALDEVDDSILIVTVYQPSLEEWEDDWKTRK